jgi:N5-(carboxyethyl)ornithine synthase
MKVGLIKANFPGERRVPLLPKDIKNFNNELLVETGFGEFLDIRDQEYADRGCRILSRAEVFAQSEAIFSLKLIQPSDYPLLREKQMVIGWTHPYGSGKAFMEEQALPKKLIIVDLDSNSPCIYYENKVLESGIPKGLLYKNSFYAGYAGVLDALMKYGLIPTEETKIAILGSGNVAQGAFSSISKYSSNIRMYYRKTMPIFKKNYSEYDIIISGIEIGKGDAPILSLSEQRNLKKGTFIIDVAADAGNTIEGTHFTSMDDPIYESAGIYYYVVPNTPSLIYRNVSQSLSKILSENIFREDCSRFFEKVN